jgi:FADH2 O2-dependent halogenase
VAKELALSKGEPAWLRVLDRLPRLKSQFKGASACQPFRHMPAISFRSGTMAGKRWAMLPSAAGFVDPLLSTGFALNLMGIERLAEILGSANLGDRLQVYAQETDGDLLAASRLIGALYPNMGDFRAFTAVSLLYFAAVSFAETAHRLGKPELAPGFLLHRHPSFGPASRVLLERAYKADASFAADVQRVIEPFNVGGFGDPARHNRYAVRADDLLDAQHKLGANREEVIGMLEKAGFFAQASMGH